VEPDNGAILQQQSEFSMVKSSTVNRAQQRNEDITNLAKVGEKQNHQKERLSKVIQAMEENEVIKEQMKKAQTSLRDGKKKLVEIGPHKAQDWLGFAKQCIQLGIEYARRRFMDIDIENRGRGTYEINKGLQASKAFIGASVFDPTILCKMSLEEVKASLRLLTNFNFVTDEMINDAIKDADYVHAYVLRNNTLPNINLTDHRIMMRMNEVKKEKALRRIENRRRSDKEAANENIPLQVEEDGFIELPNGILPGNAEVLRTECKKVNKRAYSIMEWWRLTAEKDSADIGLPRFKIFSSWGKLVSLISLCVPSSAAVERVFSLLKLCKSKNKYDMFHDELEASMMLRYNDIVV